MKVVIGIDDSPYSQAVLNWVKRTPWPVASRFIVVSAVPIQIPAYSMLEIGGMAAINNLQHESMASHRELVASAQRELQAARLATEQKVEPGDPREVLIRTVEAERADLLVVGSRGRTGLPRLLMGSVASHVASHAPCTVVIVKQPLPH